MRGIEGGGRERRSTIVGSKEEAVRRGEEGSSHLQEEEVPDVGRVVGGEWVGGSGRVSF